MHRSKYTISKGTIGKFLYYMTNVVTKEQLTKLQLVNELYIMKAPRNELKENLTLMTSL